MTKLNFLNPDHQHGPRKSADALLWGTYNLSPSFHAQTIKAWEELYKNSSCLARTYIQAQTLNYIANHKKLPLTKAVIYEGDYLPDVNKGLKKHQTHDNKNSCNISVIAKDCLYVAQKFVRQGKKVAVLNMANQFHLGGGYLYGTSAQEEDLCRRSNLSASLDPKFYNQSKNPDYEKNGFGEYTALYSDQITVIRQGNDKSYAFLNADQQFSISVISSAAYNLRNSKVAQGSQRYIQGMKNKIIMQLEVALQQGHKNLVLSAFGCGAFANDPKVVSKLYKEVLAYPRYQNAFDNIVFAIVPNPGAMNDNYGPFQTTFCKQNNSKSLWFAQVQQEWQHAPIQLFSRILLSSAACALLAISFPLSIPGAIAIAVADISLISLSYLLKPYTQNPQVIYDKESKYAKEVLSSSERQASKSYLPLRNQKSNVKTLVENETHLTHKLRKRLS